MTQPWKRRTLVLVTWLDSWADTNSRKYQDECGKMTPAHCQTVGFLLADRKGYITVAATLSQNQLLGRLTIPRGCIVKIEKLRTKGTP